MLRAVGLTDEDFRKPLIGVANTWAETTPCNAHLRQLAEWVKEGVRDAGGTPLEFNTVVVSDGITMGTPGMRASLVSREVVADSIELMALGYHFDGVVAAHPPRYLLVPCGAIELGRAGTVVVALTLRGPEPR